MRHVRRKMIQIDNLIRCGCYLSPRYLVVTSRLFTMSRIVNVLVIANSLGANGRY